MVLRNLLSSSALALSLAGGVFATTRGELQIPEQLSPAPASSSARAQLLQERLAVLRPAAVLLAQDAESDDVPFEVLFAHDSNGNRFVRFRNGEVRDRSDDYLWVVDTARGSYAAFRVMGNAADSARIRRYLLRHGLDVPSNRIDDIMRLVTERGAGRMARRQPRAPGVHVAEPSTALTDFAASGPEQSRIHGPFVREATGEAVGQACGGEGRLLLDTVDPLFVSVNKTQGDVAWNTGAGVLSHMDKTCWAKPSEGYPYPLNTLWRVVSCTQTPTFFGGGAFDVRTIGDYINWDFGDDNQSTTTWSMVAQNYNEFARYSWDIEHLNQGESSLLLIGIITSNYRYYDCAPPPPDCSGCVWREGDPIPPEEEVPCGGQGGPGWSDECDCCMGTTPILVNIRGDLTLSARDGGVMFDMNATGKPALWGWPVGDDDGWLVVDRNGNGTIDDGRELFGSATMLRDGRPARNGFVALREFDTNGDGVVDGRDPGFSALRIWLDTVRDGKSDPAELVTPAAAGVRSFSLEAHVSNRRDQWGNLFRWRAPVRFDSGTTRYAYDVVLTPFRLASRPRCAPPVLTSQ